MKVSSSPNSLKKMTKSLLNHVTSFWANKRSKTDDKWVHPKTTEKTLKENIVYSKENDPKVRLFTVKVKLLRALRKNNRSTIEYSKNDHPKSTYLKHIGDF